MVKATAQDGREKSKAKRRKLERDSLVAGMKEKSVLPKDAVRIEHLNYKVGLSTSMSGSGQCAKP